MGKRTLAYSTGRGGGKFGADFDYAKGKVVDPRAKPDMSGTAEWHYEHEALPDAIKRGMKELYESAGVALEHETSRAFDYSSLTASFVDESPIGAGPIGVMASGTLANLQKYLDEATARIKDLVRSLDELKAKCAIVDSLESENRELRLKMTSGDW